MKYLWMFDILMNIILWYGECVNIIWNILLTIFHNVRYTKRPFKNWIFFSGLTLPRFGRSTYIWSYHNEPAKCSKHNTWKINRNILIGNESREYRDIVVGCKCANNRMREWVWINESLWWPSQYTFYSMYRITTIKWNYTCFLCS